MRIIMVAFMMLTLAEYFPAAGSVPSKALFHLDTFIDKVSVRPEDLPEAVKSTLAGSYAEWKVSSAFLVTKEDNSQYYEVNIKKGEEASTVNLDKYGKKLD